MTEHVTGGERDANSVRRGAAAATRWLTALSIAAFALVVLASCIRLAQHVNVPGEVGSGNWALVDFRDAVYYPTVSFLSGENPYDTEKFLSHFPVENAFPPFTPLFLLTHAPFALLPHAPAQLLYFVITALLTVVLAAFTLKTCGANVNVASVAGLSTIILASRPGHWNLMLGQVTLEFVLAVYVALSFGRRSAWLSGLALAWATMKPTYGLPLVALMLAQRFYRPVLIGIGLTAIATLPLTLALAHAAGGVAPLITSMTGSFAGVVDAESANPVISTSRIDAFALLSRPIGEPLGIVVEIGVFTLVVALAWFAIRRALRLPAGRERSLFCAGVACLAILCAGYQLAYNAIILALPITALMLGRWAPKELAPSPTVRLVLVSLLSVPAVNYLIAPRVLRHLDPGSLSRLVVVSANGAAALTAFAIYVVLARRRPRPCAGSLQGSESTVASRPAGTSP